MSDTSECFHLGHAEKRQLWGHFSENLSIVTDFRVTHWRQCRLMSLGVAWCQATTSGSERDLCIGTGKSSRTSVCSPTRHSSAISHLGASAAKRMAKTTVPQVNSCSLCPQKTSSKKAIVSLWESTAQISTFENVHLLFEVLFEDQWISICGHGKKLIFAQKCSFAVGDKVIFSGNFARRTGTTPSFWKSFSVGCINN